MYIFSELNFFPLFLLLALWGLGGWLITARVFDLPARERGLISLGIGLAVGTWLANWLARFMPTTPAFWCAALLTVAIGVALAWPLKRDLFPMDAFTPWAWLVFMGAVFVFTLIGRGMAIFDDYQNLPQLSSMALGDIPPHFAFDSRLVWSYHYFLLLVAAQVSRLAGAAPWTAMDVARGLTMALTLSLGGMLAYRLTRNRVASTLSMAFLYFAGGARWILFLLPARLLQAASAGVTLIGSGADTGPNLIIALGKYWKIQGIGPLQLPFMYGSGLDASLVMAQAGYGTSMIMLVLLLLLLAGRGRGWISQAVSAVLLAALALSNEVTFTLLYVGVILVVVFWVIKNRSLRLPRTLWAAAPAFIAGGLLALVQGGIFTGVVAGWISRLEGAKTEALYQVSFALRSPAVLSAHLGSLSLLNPAEWFVILAETGLTILVLPWVVRYGLDLVRDEKWLEAAWVFSIIPSLWSVFLDYTGNAGPTALSRMTAHFLMVLKIYAVPLLWLWAQGRSDAIKTALLGWGLAACLSGVALFSLQLAGMPNPVYADYLGSLDAQVYAKYWGTLPHNALVFDFTPGRGDTVLGLHSIAGINYGPPTDPTYVSLEANPDPYRINAAGYRYVYFDLQDWRKYESYFGQSCVVLLDQVQESDANGKALDLRRLMDVGACR